MRLALSHPVPRAPISHALCALVGAAGLAALAAPAAAQTTVEEVTVVGRLGPGGRPETLSRAVSYADLDITTRSGQNELRRRINVTARDLCRQLGERRGRGSLGRSCEDVAIRDAMGQMRVAVASAAPRPPGWAPGQALAAAEPPPPTPPPAPAAAAAPSFAAPASATVRIITNGPVPDTPENRARFGGPNSRAGRATEPRGN